MSPNLAAKNLRLKSTYGTWRLNSKLNFIESFVLRNFFSKDWTETMKSAFSKVWSDRHQPTGLGQLGQLDVQARGEIFRRKRPARVRPVLRDLHELASGSGQGPVDGSAFHARALARIGQKSRSQRRAEEASRVQRKKSGAKGRIVCLDLVRSIRIDQWSLSSCYYSYFYFCYFLRLVLSCSMYTNEPMKS